MQTQTKHTLESVAADLRAEFAALNRKWRRSGDVNDIEYGGVRYRKSKSGEGIEYIYYIGLDSHAVEMGALPNIHNGVVYLDDMISYLPAIWNFADVASQGLCIGWLLQTLDNWNGYLTRT